MTWRSVDFPPVWKYGPLNSTLRRCGVLKVPATSVDSVFCRPPLRIGTPSAGSSTSPTNGDVRGAAGGTTGLPFASRQVRPPPGTLNVVCGLANTFWKYSVQESGLPNGSVPPSPGFSRIGRTPTSYQPTSYVFTFIGRAGTATPLMLVTFTP